MFTKAVLSVCIPTNNRSTFLYKNLNVLKDIIPGLPVEIVIGNDASNDNTEDVINTFVKNNPKIKVVVKKFKKRVFFDRIVLAMVEAASGEFCWLLGDDDIPQKGSIKKILSIIQKHPNLSLIHLNYSRFDNLVNKVTAKKMINGIKKDILFEKYEDFYFKKIDNSYFQFLGTHTITMSSDVINRKKWKSVSKKLKKYIGHNFIHSFVIGNIIKGSKTVYFVSKPQVQYLSNNHRIWPNDIWKDYNNVLLGHLEGIGYSRNKIEMMKNQQKEYEGRESIMKNPIVRRLYSLVGPLYSKFLIIKSKFV